MLTDEELSSLGVPAQHFEPFRRYVDWALAGLVRQSDIRKVPSKSAVTKALDKRIAELQMLRDALDPDLQEIEIADVVWRAKLTGQSKFSTYDMLNMLDDMTRAATAAKSIEAGRDRGGQSGTRLPGFDEFIYRLYVAARICGFDWTSYRDRDSDEDEAAGSLPKLLDLLIEKQRLRREDIPQATSTLLKAIGRTRKAINPNV